MFKINLISGIFLLILGFLIKKFELTYLIAGYNTASAKEKKKYDKEKLINCVGNFLMCLAGILISGGILGIILSKIKNEIFIFSWILFITYSVFWIIYINVGGHLFKKDMTKINKNYNSGLGKN